MVDVSLGFDKPLFKTLAPSDTGDSPGKQAGPLIPAEMDSYFPQLKGQASPTDPAPFQQIKADLFVGSTGIGLVNTRYQYQTWGGKRTPERRITGSLGAVYTSAAGGDYLLIERSLDDPRLYRLTLLKKGTPEYNLLNVKVGTRKWGPVNISEPPVSETDILIAKIEQEKHEAKPLSLFDNDAASKETTTKKVVRSRAFQRRLSEIYGNKCCVCGKSFIDLKGRYEAEAAHVVPRHLKGADDARNGLLLCRSHHWAFDRGLFGVGADGKIMVPMKILSKSNNSDLVSYNGVTLISPSIASLKPSPQALAWHLKHIVS